MLLPSPLSPLNLLSLLKHLGDSLARLRVPVQLGDTLGLNDHGNAAGGEVAVGLVQQFLNLGVDVLSLQ